MRSSQRQCIKDLLDPEEKRVLEHLYVTSRVATDQLRRCPEVLNAITSAFERLTSRSVEPSMLLRYMVNRRKEKDWPTLGARAEKFTSLLDVLSARELEALRAAYVHLGHSVDEYNFRPTIAGELAREFATRSGSAVQGEILVAVMMGYRKRGLWPTIFTPATLGLGDGGAFEDIRDVERVHKTGT